MDFQVHHYESRQRGISYVEALITVTITAILVGGLMGVISTATNINEDVKNDNDLVQQAHFAMERMVSITSKTRNLLLPQADKSYTNWPENIREETVPASPPIGDSTLATAVLAVTLPEDIDLDKDGFPDADDDEDGLIDEDPPADIHNDSSAGIYLIDDGGDGTVDEGPNSDDDEALSGADDDSFNGIDDDNDNNIDEDPSADINADGCSGICGVDDNENGLIDEANVNDDDEDGQQDEDWINPLVFYLDNGVLKERMPVPWDESGQGGITGRDYLISDLAVNVTRFRVERVPVAIGSDQLVDLLLELTHPVTGEVFSVHSQVRVGSAL